MHIMIIGAAGMIGRKLTKECINAQTQLGGNKLSLTLVDIVEPSKPKESDSHVFVKTIKADFSDEKTATMLAKLQPDTIYHLAAVVSGEAESNFEKGYAANVSASWQFLEAIRKTNTRPKFIFSSSLAVFGPPFFETITDQQYLRPASSYGTQKTIVEYLISDYTRKGYIQGLTLRLPTIVVRPGTPNAAASSFLSSIIREPLAGEKAILPVQTNERVWISSPGIAVKNLVHAAMLESEKLEGISTINLPGITVSIEQMIDALIHIGGNALSSLIIQEKNELIESIVCSWPYKFDTQVADKLQFMKDSNINAIIDQHIKEHN